MLGCIPKIGFVTCLEVPQKSLWVGGWLESEYSDHLLLIFILALAKPNNTCLFETRGEVSLPKKYLNKRVNKSYTHPKKNCKDYFSLD
jgi:hypothetical protein